jgi:sugar phosphate isomerase/epimerase
MKKAICHYSFHRRWTAEKWTAERLAEEVKALGVEGVDFHAGMMAPSGTAVERIRAALSKTGLTLSGLSLGNDFNKENPKDFQTEVDRVKEWIRVAAELRAPVSRIFGGSLGEKARGDPAAKAQGRQRILDGLGAVVKDAEKCGLVLAIENHGGLPCTGEEQVDVIRAVNSPSLKATIDVGNYLEGDQEAHVGTRVAASQAAYIHFKDFKKIPDASARFGRKLQACVLGEGDVDLRACLDALKRAGYNGFVALEYEGTEAETTGVPKSVAHMKKVMQGF